MSELQPTLPEVTVPPGKSVRFAVVADDGRRSETWMVWTSKNKLDVYVTPRSIGGTWKVSLHESGSWQYGFISDDKAAGQVKPGGQRHMDIWQRPPDLGPGLVRACTIVVPDSELRHPPTGWIESKPIVHVAAPGDGYAAVIEVAVLSAASPISGIRFGEQIIFVACLMRADSSVALVIARRKTWSEDNQHAFDTQKRRLLPDDPPQLGTEGASFRRVMLLTTENDGSRRFLEGAALADHQDAQSAPG